MSDSVYVSNHGTGQRNLLFPAGRGFSRLFPQPDRGAVSEQRAGIHVAPPRPVGERRQALMPFLATQVAANPNVTVLEWLNGKPAFSGKVAGMLKDVMMRWATS